MRTPTHYEDSLSLSHSVHSKKHREPVFFIVARSQTRFLTFSDRAFASGSLDIRPQFSLDTMLDVGQTQKHSYTEQFIQHEKMWIARWAVCFGMCCRP